MFPYALSPCHEGAKQNTIGVVRGVNAKLPHCMGFALIYPMENEMTPIYHIIEWWGWGCTIEDGKGVNEKDIKKSNNETHVQVDACEVGANASIEQRWSQGFCRNPTLAKCGGEAQHFQSWGFGVLRDSRMFRARQQGPKHLALRCSWCHWKGLET